jgi:1,4-alpha-glucan branching enzyme
MAIGTWKQISFLLDKLTTTNHYRWGSPNEARPCFALQLDGVHGASTIVDLQAYSFKDEQWEGIPLEQYLIYELHVGTFSADGNFKAIEQRLDHLVELGVTAFRIDACSCFPRRTGTGDMTAYFLLPFKLISAVQKGCNNW